MRFRDFLQLSEEQSGTDKGMLGFPLASSVRKPSDGQPFKNNASCAGQTPRGGGGGMAGAPGASPMAMMKKYMKKS